MFCNNQFEKKNKYLKNLFIINLKNIVVLEEEVVNRSSILTLFPSQIQNK